MHPFQLSSKLNPRYSRHLLKLKSVSKTNVIFRRSFAVFWKKWCLFFESQMLYLKMLELWVGTDLLEES